MNFLTIKGKIIRIKIFTPGNSKKLRFITERKLNPGLVIKTYLEDLRKVVLTFIWRKFFGARQKTDYGKNDGGDNSSAIIVETGYFQFLADLL